MLLVQILQLLHHACEVHVLVALIEFVLAILLLVGLLADSWPNEKLTRIDNMLR